MIMDSSKDGWWIILFKIFSRLRVKNSNINVFQEEFPRIGRACLLALKTRRVGESLVQYDLNTGKLIREIFLSHIIKFR